MVQYDMRGALPGITPRGASGSLVASVTALPGVESSPVKPERTSLLTPPNPYAPVNPHRPPMIGPLHRRLWEWLELFAPGRAKAVPRSRIHANLEDPRSERGRVFLDMTDRHFRRIAEELLAAGYLALACEDGYYAGQDEEDVTAYTRYILAKAVALRRKPRLARYALEETRRRKASEPIPRQLESRRLIAPVGEVAQPSRGQGRLL